MCIMSVPILTWWLYLFFFNFFWWVSNLASSLCPVAFVCGSNFFFKSSNKWIYMWITCNRKTIYTFTVALNFQFFSLFNSIIFVCARYIRDLLLSRQVNIAILLFLRAHFCIIFFCSNKSGGEKEEQRRRKKTTIYFSVAYKSAANSLQRNVPSRTRKFNHSYGVYRWDPNDSRRQKTKAKKCT